jgi:dTDP-4-dehydrorhamnose reductase
MPRSRRFAITGANGQLGRALQRALGASADVVSLTRPQVDITDWPAVRHAVAHARPHIVLHCAAATDVDGCERDPEMAHRINALGTRNVAHAAAAAGAWLVAVSTNYVFDGSKLTPYHEFDGANPINSYGASKLAGEREALAATPRCQIVRTAWLYAEDGHNFVQTMRRMMAERDEVSTVDDQFGNPTYAADLAGALLHLPDCAPPGIYHLTNTGATSWHGWATEIQRLTGARAVINPIPGALYKRLASPPANGTLVSLALDRLGLQLPDWRDALARCLAP